MTSSIYERVQDDIYRIPFEGDWLYSVYNSTYNYHQVVTIQKVDALSTIELVEYLYGCRQRALVLTTMAATVRKRAPLRLCVQ